MRSYNEKYQRQLADEITKNVLDIESDVKDVKASIRKIIDKCNTLAALVNAAKDKRPRQIGAWFAKWCPQLPYKRVKPFCTVATWTVAKEQLYARQLRFLGIISTDYRKQKAKSSSVKRVRSKTWLYHIMKGKEILTRDIESAGGLDALSDEEKKAIESHLKILNE